VNSPDAFLPCTPFARFSFVLSGSFARGAAHSATWHGPCKTPSLLEGGLSVCEAVTRERRGTTVLWVASTAIESYGLCALERLDRIEEGGYKATQRILPALRRALVARPLHEGASALVFQGGTGGS